MEVFRAGGAGRQRGVSVEIGAARARSRPRRVVRLCIVGISPPNSPWMAELLPSAVVRDTRFKQQDHAVEHVRLRSRKHLGGLPSLSSRFPSRLRDAALLALTAGASDVDVVLVRSRGARPWDFHLREVHELLAPFLAELEGAALAMPDLGGPISIGPGTGDTLERRIARFQEAVRRFAPMWSEYYQVGLLDAIDVPPDRNLEILRSVLGSDAALCRWSGPDHKIRAHGWRSAASVIGGVLASDEDDVGRGLTGRQVTLSKGRLVNERRLDDLALVDEQVHTYEGDESYVDLRLHPRRDRIQIVGEPTFRQPLGSWFLPALRSAKEIHRRLVKAAEAFTFRSADDAQAMALATSLTRAVRPFVNNGMLVGATDDEAPTIKGGVDRIPGQPGLNAVLTARLQPWSQNVVVRVLVRPGAQPVVDVL